MKDVAVAQWANNVDDFISCYEPVWKAWRVMKEKGVRLLPVLSNKKVVGLVTAQDIVRASDHNGGQSMAVKEAMSLDPLIVHKDTSVHEVMQAMVGREQQVAVVVDSEGQVVGMFSWSDAFTCILDRDPLNIRREA